MPDIAKFSYMWMIPNDAEKPVDARMKPQNTQNGDN